MLYLIEVHFYRLSLAFALAVCRFPFPMMFAVADNDSRVQGCVRFDKGGEGNLLLVCKQE